MTEQKNNPVLPGTLAAPRRSGDLAGSVAMLMALCIIGLVGASPVAAEPERSVLPLAEPPRVASTILDARDATPPPFFTVAAPKGAPNVLLVLIDDLGFGGTSAFGGPVATPSFD